MKKIQFANSVFGPYQSVEVLEDRYRCDGADLPFSVVGQGVVSDAAESDFPQLPMSDAELNQLEMRQEQSEIACCQNLTGLRCLMLLSTKMHGPPIVKPYATCRSRLDSQ